MSKIIDHLLNTTHRSTVETVIAETTNELQLNYPTYDGNGNFNQANADANSTWQSVLFDSDLAQGQDYIETIAASEDRYHHYPNYIENCKKMFDLGAYNWFIVDDDKYTVRIAKIADLKRLAQEYDIKADPDGIDVQDWSEIADNCSETLRMQLGI